jgi:peptidylamidoglycolate lyase
MVRLYKPGTILCESEKYQNEKSFVPTETAVTKDGDIYVADGYGEQYIIHYGADGKLKNIFGGRGTEPKHLDNAHGICIDARRETTDLDHYRQKPLLLQKI